LQAWRTNLAEEPLTTLQPAADGRVSLAVGGHQIATILFRDR
jgi:hypothetical protein